MNRLRRIAGAALAAGIAGGLLLAALQAAWVTPLIQRAEVYEQAAPTAGSHVTQTPATPAGSEPAAQAAPQPWTPAEGAQRIGLTVLADVLAGVGFALLLAAGMSLREGPPSVAQGLLWGAAGYAAFVLAPALGLPPELPGAVAASLAARQAWWLGTVAATAGGLALLAFAPRWGRALGVLLLLVPHVAGAPQPPPAVHEALPAALAAQFVAAVLGTAAPFWAVLGAGSAWLLARLR